jgi:hypothetical protein
MEHPGGWAGPDGSVGARVPGAPRHFMPRRRTGTHSKRRARRTVIARRAAPKQSMRRAIHTSLLGKSATHLHAVIAGQKREARHYANAPAIHLRAKSKISVSKTLVFVSRARCGMQCRAQRGVTKDEGSLNLRGLILH